MEQDDGEDVEGRDVRSNDGNGDVGDRDDEAEEGRQDREDDLKQKDGDAEVVGASSGHPKTSSRCTGRRSATWLRARGSDHAGSVQLYLQTVRLPIRN